MSQTVAPGGWYPDPSNPGTSGTGTGRNGPNSAGRLRVAEACAKTAYHRSNLSLFSHAGNSGPRRVCPRRGPLVVLLARPGERHGPGRCATVARPYAYRMDWSRGCPKCNSILTMVVRNHPPRRTYAPTQAVSYTHVQCQYCRFSEIQMEGREWLPDHRALFARAKEIVVDRGMKLWPFGGTTHYRMVGEGGDRRAVQLDPLEALAVRDDGLNIRCAAPRRLR
jgi:hypothetical protein